MLTGDRNLLQRTIQQIIRDDDHFFGKFRIGKGVAHTAAGGFSHFAGTVTLMVGCGCGNECHVNGCSSQGDILGSATVGAELHGIL